MTRVQQEELSLIFQPGGITGWNNLTELPLPSNGGIIHRAWEDDGSAGFETRCHTPVTRVSELIRD